MELGWQAATVRNQTTCRLVFCVGPTTRLIPLLIAAGALLRSSADGGTPLLALDQIPLGHVAYKRHRYVPPGNGRADAVARLVRGVVIQQSVGGVPRRGLRLVSLQSGCDLPRALAGTVLANNRAEYSTTPLLNRQEEGELGHFVNALTGEPDIMHTHAGQVLVVSENVARLKEDLALRYLIAGGHQVSLTDLVVPGDQNTNGVTTIIAAGSLSGADNIASFSTIILQGAGAYWAERDLLAHLPNVSVVILLSHAELVEANLWNDVSRWGQTPDVRIRPMELEAPAPAGTMYRTIELPPHGVGL